MWSSTRNNKSGSSDSGGDVVPLPKWINRVLDNSATSDLEISSDSYIIPALRIASSLAEQICQAEEEESNNDVRVILPTPDSNWSSKIVVQLEDDDAKKPLSNDQLGNNEDNSPDSTSKTFLNEFIGHQTCSENDVQEGSQHTSYYLAVTRAQLLSTEADADNNDNTPQEKLRRIHSLGLVLYEIFSGGDRPLLHGNDVQLDGIFDPLPVGESNKEDDLNAADALKIFDDLNDNEGLQEPHKKAVPSRPSSEQLKMMNIPGPLCELVSNMIDCISCEFSGSEEAYRSMSDVLVDLQLMMEKPAIFLRGIDLDKISSSNLQFSDSIFGRERELSLVTTAHQRSLLSLGEKELVVISGPAGSGKSYLSQRFGDHVTASGGLFLSAKFDQLKQARPLSALASVFNDYCETLSLGVSGEEKAAASLLASELRSRLSGGVIYLAKIIPSLVNILGHDSCVSLGEDNNCIDAQQRLQFLLCQFVEAITISSSAPITLHLDDLHNADDASIGVINQLLFTTKSCRIFFLVTSRDDKNLWKLLANLDHFQVPRIQIKLDNLDEVAINKTLSELLQLSPRFTRPLSSIAHHKTRGNALFFSHWIMSLSREGLLRPSLSRRRWVWDEDEIRRAKLPDDVAVFFQNSIYKLPKDVQDALSVMACFGASLDGALTNSLERALLMQLVVPLDVAVSEGLLDKINDRYLFCHDRVQEAAYNMIRSEEKCLYHFQYGLSLAKLYLSEESLGQGNDNILFAAVNQLNLGGPAALKAVDESFTVSTLNLSAGKKAMSMSDFKDAYSFFDNGISFLRKKHWQQHYGLSFELFCLGAKCALATGDFVSLKLLSEQVLTNANTFEEKIPVVYYSMCALTFSGQFSKGAVQIESILSQQLGEALPGQSSSSTMLQIVSQTLDRLELYSITELKGLKRMTDSTKNITMLFLKLLHFGYFVTNPEKQPIVITKMIELTLSHGTCEGTPLAFAFFGSMLGKLGNIEKGYQYANLARQLVEENPAFYESSRGEIIASAAQLSCYVEPAQAVMPLFIEACERCMSAGDAATACLSILYYCNEASIAGIALPTVKEKCSEARQLMKQLNHYQALSHLVIIERHLQSLMGPSWEGVHHNAEEEEEKVEGANPHTIFFSIVYGLFNNFMFRRYDASKSFLQRFLAHNRVDWTLMFAQSEVTFIFGLTAFWMNRSSKEQSWMKAGVKAREAMKEWTKSSKWNFEHKLLLLDAEKNFCDGNFKQAKILYDKAIKSAKEHRFVNGEALSCELAGYFYLELGEKNTAQDYFAKAHERYIAWGALGKAAALNQEIARENSISLQV